MPNLYLPPVITTPSSLEITSISQSFPAVITVEIANSSTEANTYQPGQLIKAIIPYSFGMQQMNNKTMQILQVNGFDITVDVDSTNFDPFVIPMSTAEAPPTIAPSGSRNVEFSKTTGQLPFKSLNNIGN
jgi:hypothetical protein